MNPICVRRSSRYPGAARRVSIRRVTLQRSLQRLMLEHGDVVVWGRESRLYYHGIQPLKPGVHPQTGEFRFNLTFRQTAPGKQK